MPIQHRDIPEGEIHEPKGASLASTGSVYVANGLGSGDWKLVSSSEIAGLGSQGGIGEQYIVSDGAEGFKYVSPIAYGSKVISNSNASFAVDAATDPTLNTNTDYKTVSGLGAPWTNSLSFRTTLVSDGIQVQQKGVYKVETWIDIVQFPNNMARCALKYTINGTSFSDRKISTKSNSAGDAGNLTGFGLVELNEGDIVRIAIASTHAGSFIFESANVAVTLVRPTE